MLKDILKPKPVDQIISDCQNWDNSSVSLTKIVLDKMHPFAYNDNKQLIISIIKDPSFNSVMGLYQIFEKACKEGMNEIVTAILKKDLIDPSRYNNFALRIAYDNDHWGIVESLLSCKKVQETLEPGTVKQIQYILNKPLKFRTI